ncbi:YdcH family protein [Nordella sp. HKS 07]|uniref:YdcH family protein n=2 Tax=Hyphomicrobiales TaxID=356 RepID=UPI00352DBB48
MEKSVRKRGRRRMIDGTEENLLQTRLMTLRQQHRDLDAAISSLEASGTGDQLQLRRLKKMKLQIKDEIQKVEDKLIPDIIA